jgi:hypothetical protein
MTKYLYRKWRQAVTLATAMLVLSPALAAQWGAPLPERKTPRAVGVLETYADGARRLIPVTFFYERHYYDATFYHATPVPFTLYSETVYEVQRFGQPLGTFTVHSATRSATAWFGNGRFKAAPDAATLARRKAPAPVVVEDPSRPVLHRREGSEGDHPAAAKTNAPEAEEDPERPKLRRREGSDSDGSTPAQAPAAAQAGPAPETKQPAAAVAAPAEPASGGEPEHPILRRGKPVEEQSGRDLPDFQPETKPGAMGPEPVLRQIAVSDAGPSEPQELIFACRQKQRQQMEAAARELAQSELRRLAARRGLVLPETATAKPPAASKSGLNAGLRSKPGAAAEAATTPVLTFPPLTFEDEQFVPYDLDYNSYATVVFSARYWPAAAGAGAMGDATLPAAGVRGESWVVTVIARQDEDNLVRLYSAVSDPRELDLYPEVRLVDAVDPDGYGRFALLFRQQKRDGVSWLLGRATGYELQTLFETAAR